MHKCLIASALIAVVFLAGCDVSISSNTDGDGKQDVKPTTPVKTAVIRRVGDRIIDVWIFNSVSRERLQYGNARIYLKDEYGNTITLSGGYEVVESADGMSARIADLVEYHPEIDVGMTYEQKQAKLKNQVK